MKTVHSSFKESWFLCTIAGAIILGEIIAWKIAGLCGVRINPVTVAFVCTGIVAVVTSLRYEGEYLG